VQNEELKNKKLIEEKKILEKNNDILSNKNSEDKEKLNKAQEEYKQLKARLEEELAKNKKLTEGLIEKEKKIMDLMQANKLIEEEEEKTKIAKRKELKLNCEFCKEMIKNNHEVIAFSNCPHISHKFCLESYIKSKIKEGAISILCPFCDTHIHTNDIKDSISEDWYKQYSNIYINKDPIKKYAKDIKENYSMISCCPTIGCLHTFVWDNNKSTLDFTCPLCKKGYCLKCRSANHEDKKCKANQKMLISNVIIIFT